MNTTGRPIECSRKAESHSGTLRKDGDRYVCWECWAKEVGVPTKSGSGRPTFCKSCGEVLVTRDRKGGMRAHGQMTISDRKTTLTCKCGRTRTIKNPTMAGRSRSPQARSQSPDRRISSAMSDGGRPPKDEPLKLNPALQGLLDAKGPVLFHDGKDWIELNDISMPRCLALGESIVSK